MKLLIAPLALACLLSSPWLFAQASTAPSARTRLEALARPVAVVSAFSETRHTPLKKRPVVVTGVARLDRDRGLSLSYDQPGSPLVILDERGLLLRHPDGREQVAPPEAAEDLRLLHALFAFDLTALESAYDIVASEDDNSWTVRCIRKPTSTAAYRELTLAGAGPRLQRLQLAKTANLRTDITLAEPTTPEAFTAEERARYFR